MVSDLITVSIQQFQEDCLQLCDQHYPTVHNRGMRENHLGKALCRRMMSTFQQADITPLFTQIDDENALPQPIYNIKSNEFTVWVIAHHLLSANIARRDALVHTIKNVSELFDANTKNYLLLVADHWFDRSKASKEIPSWWLGQLPENIEDYYHDGIKLLETPNTLPVAMNECVELTNGLMQIHHPLKSHASNKTVHKYILLTAIYTVKL
ncbi:hypothetical protein [Photobacterium indicum]|uniref:hypothetical protein n=1 Tax=Photobacterium indicum TaxID=81447 RepID=UPI003D0B99CC